MLYFLLPPLIQEPGNETHFTGVNQGKTLFIQNPYDPVLGRFCIDEVYVNGKKKSFNTKLSAVVLDFGTLDLFTPVTLRIVHKDSCSPIIINPDAIFFHTTFSFKEISISDSLLMWKVVGDKIGGQYVVESYEVGLWMESEVLAAKGIFEGTSYEFIPYLKEGANKFRIKYIFPDNKYLYSREMDFHYYPEPVTISPKRTNRYIKFSRSSPFKIYDPEGKMVKEGIGAQVDVSTLWKGDYVIYFEGKDPSSFTKE